jgi:cytolysin-activating lysine-acyltransferase
MTDNKDLPDPQQLAAARKELDKLPLLGPVVWLFARDQNRRFTFMADIDWRLIPPLVLDQCKLYSKMDLPWAFVTWAMVSDAIHERLLKGGVIAPTEWRSGEHLWLVDVVTPFGDAPAVAQETLAGIDPSKVGHAWITSDTGLPALKEFRPTMPPPNEPVNSSTKH